jgi:hypothetical protein
VHAVFLIRTNTDPKSVLSEVRNAVRDLDPTQPIYHVETINEVLSDSLARQRMVAVLLGIFALLALTLAAIGIYGVIAYSVTQRTREIGVRMAVGSSRANILLLMLRDAASFTGIGVLAGLIAAFAGAHLASALLFQTSSADPFSICVSVSALLSSPCRPLFFRPAARPRSIRLKPCERSEKPDGAKLLSICVTSLDAPYTYPSPGRDWNGKYGTMPSCLDSHIIAKSLFERARFWKRAKPCYQRLRSSVLACPSIWSADRRRIRRNAPCFYSLAEKVRMW